MDRMSMTIEGMSCGHCVNAVSKALADLDGVQVEHVKIGTATVLYDPDTITEARIADAVADEGYVVASTAR